MFKSKKYSGPATSRGIQGPSCEGHGIFQRPCFQNLQLPWQKTILGMKVE